MTSQQSDAYDYRRYLAAKTTVDDRALNLRVWNALAAALSDTERTTPLRILELGAGIGTMIERTLGQGLLQSAGYTAIDLDPENIAEAARRLPEWAAAHGYDVRAEPLTLSGGDQTVRVALEAIDVFDLVARERGRRDVDLTITHAFLDLVDVDALLPGLLSLLKPGGLLYATVNFDGMTLFEPEIDPALDRRIESLYHQTMNARSGGSHSGRRLFSQLTNAGVEILEAGSSDWVVHPGSSGGYPADEAYFLHHIVNTVSEALRDHPELNAVPFTEWVAKRHAQVERAELVYIAHQLDLLARAPKEKGEA